MASDAADALAKTYARNKKLLSLRSITNGLQQTGLLVACTYFLLALQMSAFRGKADMAYCSANVRL